MKEGEDVSSYLMEVSNLWNHLTALRESISNKQLTNTVLNGLPCFYKMIIQGISYMTNPTFKDVIGKMLTETQRMNIQSQKHGQMEALAPTHHFPLQLGQF